MDFWKVAELWYLSALRPECGKNPSFLAFKGMFCYSIEVEKAKDNKVQNLHNITHRILPNKT